MKYYNAIIYWSYGSVGRYNNITDLKDFINYFDRTSQLSSITKIFFYSKKLRSDYNGSYCGYWHKSKGLSLIP